MPLGILPQPWVTDIHLRSTPRIILEHGESWSYIGGTKWRNLIVSAETMRDRTNKEDTFTGLRIYTEETKHMRLVTSYNGALLMVRYMKLPRGIGLDIAKKSGYKTKIQWGECTAYSIWVDALTHSIGNPSPVAEQHAFHTVVIQAPSALGRITTCIHGMAIIKRIN